MLVQKTVVFFVDADGVLDDSGITLASGHDGIEVVNSSLAVTSQFQRVGHETGSILTNVESVLAVVRRIGVAVGNDHLYNTDSVEEVEANVHLVSSPGDFIAAHAEGHALGLCDVDGLESAIDVILANELGHVVVGSKRNLGSLAVDETNIHSENLFLLGIENDGKVQRVSVLVVIGRSTVVHQALLKTSLVTPAVVKSNGPSIDKDLLHIGDSELLAGANDAGILAGDAFADIEILKSQGRTDVSDRLPFFDLALTDVGDDLSDLAASALNHNSESATSRARAGTSLVGGILRLFRFTQGKTVELESLGACIVADEFCCSADLIN
ncbi:hypothetical protein HG531_007046 [Fusarium graminearum]|nr:hypothetical protein HG531_007046 [Fusarium graminearum]